MVDTLNETLIAEYKASFDIIDKDRDGLISIQELEQMMKRLGQDYNQVEIEEMIDEVCLTDKKSVDFKEFLGLMTRKVKDIEVEDELLEAFKVFDKDGNGFITLDELKDIIQRIEDGVQDTDIQDMLTEADEDKDGKLSFEEFVKIMKNF